MLRLLSHFSKIWRRVYPSMKTIHVFYDNARYYKNKDVRSFLKKSKISFHFLSPYSPNLNLIERLWKWMKEWVVYNTYYEHFEEFKMAIMNFFKILSNLDPTSPLVKDFKSRVANRFRPIGSVLSNSWFQIYIIYFNVLKQF